MEITQKMTYKLRKAEIAAMRRKAAKPLLYLSLTSLATLFAGLTSAYIVRSNHGNWLVFKLPDTLFISTALIVASSVTMLFAQDAVRKNNYNRVSMALFATLALGLSFFCAQFAAWQELVSQGIYFTGKQANVSGSFLYVITFVHLLHMVAGIIALLFSFVKALLKRYSSQNYLGLHLTAVYWHFLDVVWLYLFFFLYFFR